MYTVSNVDRKLCHVLRHHLDLLEEDCSDIYSIWNFCPRTRWKAISKLFAEKPLCQAQWFPVIYWVVLVISTLGSVSGRQSFIWEIIVKT